MPYRANYPRTVREVLDDAKTYKPDALRAVKRFARSKPWRGTMQERRDKFKTCIRELAAVYGVAEPTLIVGPGRIDCYRPRANKIELSHLSVVTLLHEFGHVRGFDERMTCRWSINLFRRCFPRSFASCRQVGRMLRRS